MSEFFNKWEPRLSCLKRQLFRVRLHLVSEGDHEDEQRVQELSKGMLGSLASIKSHQQTQERIIRKLRARLILCEARLCGLAQSDDEAV